ncbi:hypothetical protein AK812_SmicGene38892 [Symbiodinium microadriaticum]|uniref:Uncharacterized protein n=1 Tax=Symbiodinium microadriaticum TaxID=2951 RepID=A0A1Q9CCM4_SYMMI|nr:hypothetical protein AK812_SmicGene38892 [Symbiodinium microadriaticum]
MSTSSSQQSTLHFVLPSVAVLGTCLAPAILVAVARRPGSPLGEEARNTVAKPLSLLSLLIILLCCVFLLSNYSVSNLYLFAVYSLLLALANLLADRLVRQKVWPFLAVWHFFNLLNLFGGGVSLLQPYRSGTEGLIPTIFKISGQFGGECPTGTFKVDWCDDAWIAFQMIVAFIFVALHIAAFFIVLYRCVPMAGPSPAREEAAASLVDSSEVANSAAGAQPF